MGLTASTYSAGDELVRAYRELIAAEARLTERLFARGRAPIRTSVTDQWRTLEEYLKLYASALPPGGVLILAGAPDDASRLTGIPFTGPARAREALGLSADGDERSPSEEGFWAALARACPDFSPESVFSTVMLAHARPFDVDVTHEVKDASARHVLRLVQATRPQATVVVGSEALFLLARALADNRLLDVASIDETTWPKLWPPGTAVVDHPYVDVDAPRPFRTRLVPVPELDGAHARQAARTLEGVLRYACA